MKTEHLTRIASAGVALIGAVAFAISFSALQETAEAYGFQGWQSWFWPLLIDMPILVFAINGFATERITGKRNWFALAMIIVFSSATVGFNLVHSSPGVVNYAVAIMPPLAVIVSFESLLQLVRLASQVSTDNLLPAYVPPAVDTFDIPFDTPKPIVHKESRFQSTSWGDMDDDQKIVAIKRTLELTTSEAGDKLGCDPSTVYRWRGRVGATNGVSVGFP